MPDLLAKEWDGKPLGFECSVFRMVKKISHAIHYWWNRSRFNSDYDPFISSCICCCLRCEED